MTSCITWFGALLVWLSVASPASAGTPSLAGDWNGLVAGTATTVTLTVQGPAVHGPIDVGGYVYDFAGQLQGASVVGMLTDRQTGGGLQAILVHQGDALVLQMAGVPQPIRLTRKKPAQATAQHAPESARRGPGTVDGALVGTWGRTESFGGSGGGGAVEQFFVLNGDGTWAMGTGRMAMGGAGWSGGAGGMQVDGRGRWTVQNRVLHLDAGQGFVPFARVYLEGPKMMLTFGDGTHQVFVRRG